MYLLMLFCKYFPLLTIFGWMLNSKLDLSKRHKSFHCDLLGYVVLALQRMEHNNKYMIHGLLQEWFPLLFSRGDTDAAPHWGNALDMKRLTANWHKRLQSFVNSSDDVAVKCDVGIYWTTYCSFFFLLILLKWMNGKNVRVV